MKQFINPLLRVATVVTLLYIIYYRTNDLNKLRVENKIIKTECDSIKSEMFVKDIQLQRFEYILDKAEEMSSDSKAEFDKILSETE